MPKKAKKRRPLTVEQKIKLEHEIFEKLESQLPLIMLEARDLWANIYIATNFDNSWHILMLGETQKIKDSVQKLSDLFDQYLRPPNPKVVPKVANTYKVSVVKKNKRTTEERPFGPLNEMTLREVWKHMKWDNPRERKLHIERMKRFNDGGYQEMHNAFLEKFFNDTSTK